jgi:hypothetical protein
MITALLAVMMGAMCCALGGMMYLMIAEQRQTRLMLRHIHAHVMAFEQRQYFERPMQVVDEGPAWEDVIEPAWLAYNEERMAA